MSPAMLQESINDLKAGLEDKDAPFGVDLAIPQVGGSARKTNVRDAPQASVCNANVMCSMITPKDSFPSSLTSSLRARRSYSSVP